MAESNSDNSGIPPVERVRQEVDRWLDAVRSTGERALETLGLSGANRPSFPLVDIIELAEDVLVQIELPGIPSDSVELSLVGNMLTLNATRVSQDFSSEARIHLRERHLGRIQRSIPLPATVDDNAIRAETKDGLLTVTLRKATPPAGRSIPISTGSNS